MEKLIYAGKAKQVWTTKQEQVLRIVYLDQVTALNGKRKDQIKGKGQISNEISSLIFQFLSKNGIPTHYLKTISDNEELVKRVQIIPLEMVVRNVIAGHFASRFGLEEGKQLKKPVEEMYYKSDELDDPFINESQVLALGFATQDELAQMWAISRKVNKLLTGMFRDAGLKLVDFKLEFGRTSDGDIILADEFSPDNARLWDIKTSEKMDKDVYRQHTGGLASTYQDVLDRLQGVIA